MGNYLSLPFTSRTSSNTIKPKSSSSSDAYANTDNTTSDNTSTSTHSDVPLPCPSPSTPQPCPHPPATSAPIEPRKRTSGYPQQHKCPSCAKPFRSRNDFRTHLKAHYLPVECICPQCYKVFDTVGDMRDHLREGHEFQVTAFEELMLLDG